jgi:hypothetical protein
VHGPGRPKSLCSKNFGPGRAADIRPVHSPALETRKMINYIIIPTLSKVKCDHSFEIWTSILIGLLSQCAVLKVDLTMLFNYAQKYLAYNCGNKLYSSTR